MAPLATRRAHGGLVEQDTLNQVGRSMRRYGNFLSHDAVHRAQDGEPALQFHHSSEPVRLGAARYAAWRMGYMRLGRMRIGSPGTSRAGRPTYVITAARRWEAGDRRLFREAPRGRTPSDFPLFDIALRPFSG